MHHLFTSPLGGHQLVSEPTLRLSLTARSDVGRKKKMSLGGDKGKESLEGNKPANSSSNKKDGKKKK